MPTYCYRRENGEVIERVFQRGEAPDVILEENGAATRDYQAERGASRRAGGGWPMTCVASGVNANQAGELRKYLADRGCPTEVTRDGDPIYRNAEHRKRALKLRGMHDRNCYNW